MPPRQALARQRQECVLGTNRCRTGGKEKGPERVTEVTTMTSGRPALKVATSVTLNGYGMVIPNGL